MSEELPTNDRYSAILEEIKQFSEQKEEISKCIFLEGLNSKERAKIYDVFETTYYELLEFEKQCDDDDKQVVVVRQKTTCGKQMKLMPVTIDDAVVRTFRKYTKLSLPLATNDFIDYYLDCLEPYTDCRTLFTKFIQDIEAHDTVSRLKSRFEQVLDSIIFYLKDHPLIQTFKNNMYEEEMKFLKYSSYKTGGELYKKENRDKLFISLDIIKASYNIVKHYHEEVFQCFPTWEEFVLSFCGEKPVYTVMLSKSIRERIFGNVKFGKKINSLAEYFVHKVLHEMNISPANVVTLAADEVVLSYDPATFHHMLKHYHEYFHSAQGTGNQPIEIIRREFECIPLTFIMQCIKQYEGKPILEVDRKFSIEDGQVATLDKPIF